MIQKSEGLVVVGCCLPPQGGHGQRWRERPRLAAVGRQDGAVVAEGGSSPKGGTGPVTQRGKGSGWQLQSVLQLQVGDGSSGSHREEDEGLLLVEEGVREGSWDSAGALGAEILISMEAGGAGQTNHSKEFV